MERKIYGFLLIMFGCILENTDLIAQNPTNQPSLNNILPPSPNAASLGKFGDIPVGPATGIPQINIPIYSYSNPDNSLKLNISLDYHGGGVRVDEVASDVGSGWALSAGGVVTRTVRDIYDEAATYGFINSPLIPIESEGNKRGGYGTTTSWFNTIATHNADGQNDIFSFNFNGRSGKFMYGRNNDFLMLTSNKLRVEKEHGAIAGIATTEMIRKFTITDENGTRYVFDAIELSDDGTAQNYHNWTSSWYLTKIIAPSSTDSIVIEYERQYTSYTAGKFITSTYGLPPFPSRTQTTSYSTVITNGFRIKKITFPNTVAASFIYDTAVRQDMQDDSYGMSRLQQITLTDGTYTRGYNLYHDYSVNRLTLKRVLPFSSAGETAGYSFNYYGVLPARLSNQQDHWGFYNTNASGDLLPVYKDPVTGISLSGGNRDTDPERVRYGSLSRITYPTGGYTDFQMECNTSEDPRLLDSTVIVIKEKTFSMGIHCSNSAPATEAFTFNGDAGTSTAFNINVFLSGSCNSGSDCYFIVQIKNSSNQVINTQTITNDNSNTYKDQSFNLSNLAKGTYYWYVYTVGMTYDNYMTMTWKEDRSQNPEIIKTYKKQLYVGGLRVKSIQHYDGISSLPSSTQVFEYLKEDGTVSSGSLGVLPQYSYPVYYDFSSTSEHLPADGYIRYFGYGLTNAIVRASSPQQTLASINGSPVIYSRVVERLTNNSQSNGRIDRYFTSYAPGSLSGYNVFPFTPPSYVDWSYGQLEKEMIYDKNDVLVKSTENEYQTTIDPYYSNTDRLLNFTSVALGPVMHQVDNLSFDWSRITQTTYYASKTFTSAAGRKDIKKTTTTEYANGQSLTSVINYAYDIAFNVKNTTTTNSLGETLEKISYYPYEYTSAVANAMKIQNMYAPEVAVENWITKGTVKYLTGGYINQYIQNASGIRKGGIAAFNSDVPVVAASVGSFNPGSFNRDINLFKNFISFSQYTAKGYSNEQSKVNDVKHAYLYGYNGNHVIAEAINAAVSEIAYTSFEEDGRGTWSYTGVPVSDNAALSGNKVYNLSTGTISKSGLTSGESYRVSYWSKTGAASISGTTAAQGASRNGWTYFEHIVAAGITSVSLSGTVIIDDLRLCPVGANMSTFTYQPLLGITTMCNSRNEFVYYDYDGLGRLKTIKDQDNKILKLYDYQFQTSITK
jgi:YD repeat-containing protein